MKNPEPINYPTKEYQAALYKVYKAVFEQKILDENRIRLMTPLFAYQRWSWRVVGISEGAIKLIRASKYSYPKGLNRDHFIQDRTNTFRQMFPQNNVILEQNHWWNLFWKNDATIILSKLEHKNKNKQKIRCYPLNWKKGYFACKKLIGFDYRKSIEGELLKSKITSGEYLSEDSKTLSINDLRDWQGIE